MAIDNSFLIKKIKDKRELVVAFSAFTSMPYVACDDETGNDRVWIFESEELLQEFAKPYLEQKRILRGVKFKNKNFLGFFASLYLMGVNEIVFVTENGEIATELEAVVRRPDYSKMKPESRPIENPNLQLTGMYFMQEASRPVPTEEKEGLSDLEEEFAVNLTKAKYLMALELIEGPGTLQEKLKNNQFRIPIIKDQQGHAYQPLFTDPMEFQKFSKNRKLAAIGVPFSKLQPFLTKDVEGYMLNPGGFHIHISRALLDGLNEAQDEEAEEGTADGAGETEE